MRPGWKTSPTGSRRRATRGRSRLAVGPDSRGAAAAAIPRERRFGPARRLPLDQVAADLNALADYAMKLPACNGKVCVVGFSWGGDQAFRFATTRTGSGGGVRVLRHLPGAGEHPQHPGARSMVSTREPIRASAPPFRTTTGTDESGGQVLRAGNLTKAPATGSCRPGRSRMRRKPTRRRGTRPGSSSRRSEASLTEGLPGKLAKAPVPLH